MRSAFLLLLAAALPARAGVPSPLIVPQPKRVVFAGAGFSLAKEGLGYRLETHGGPDPGQRLIAAIRDWGDELERSSGVRLRPELRPRVRAGLLLNLEPPGRIKPEGYSLEIGSKSIRLRASDESGIYHGLQTLRQLLISAPGRPLEFAGARIEDWPSLRFRGVHLFVGKNALPFHRKLLERILARYKMNSLVLECEFSQWKSHPEVHVPGSMSLADLKKDVDYARARFIEPIPLINTYGHSGWMFKNGSNRHLSLENGEPGAYDPGNPRVYDFVFDVFQEAIAIFEPKILHIGHDEIEPATSDRLSAGKGDPFNQDVGRITTWLQGRGVRPMLWGDMLLHPSEGGAGVRNELTSVHAGTREIAEGRRRALARQTLVADWRYGPGKEQRNGLSRFRKSGLEAVGAAGYEPENIRGWALQAIREKALGTLQTTWVGFDVDESVLKRELHQFTAIILAAEYAWSGTKRLPSQLPYDPAKRFEEAYGPPGP